MKKMMNNKNFKEFAYFLITSFVISSLFLFYLVTIGTKLTDANNLYREAYIDYQEGNLTAAREKISESIDIVSTPESRDLDNKIQKSTM